MKKDWPEVPVHVSCKKGQDGALGRRVSSEIFGGVLCGTNVGYGQSRVFPDLEPFGCIGVAESSDAFPHWLPCDSRCLKFDFDHQIGGGKRKNKE